MLCASAAAQPALPEGLGAEEPAGPSLPEGLGGGKPQGPSLPEGLGDDQEPDGKREPEPEGKTFLQIVREFGISGFIEARGGLRTQRDPHQNQASIGEGRLHLEYQKPLEAVTFKLALDLLYDQAHPYHEVNLETGAGFLDLREAWASFTPLEFMDVKLGRQILTWGTGDLLFLNDLFPKDWQSFFIGRDVEYLKAPSDAAKVSLFSDVVNLDFVYTPRFDPDRFLRGERLSYWSGAAGGIVGRNGIVRPDVPNQWFADAEYAVRLHRRVQSYELAGYGYWGRWKSPAGQTMAGRATFPRLHVYGASARGPLGEGIANVEAAWYQSGNDCRGDNAFVNNSEFRFLAGYEQDLPKIARDLSLGVQYYLEWMADYDEYLANLPAGQFARRERRHLLTLRLTKKLLNQNLVLSLFTFYSPSDGDAYLRPKATYKIDDHWTAEVGGNVFLGDTAHTFFGQFRQNTNVYASLRFGF